MDGIRSGLISGQIVPTRQVSIVYDPGTLDNSTHYTLELHLYHFLFYHPKNLNVCVPMDGGKKSVLVPN